MFPSGQLRWQLVETARQMSELGLTPGTSGNVSCRVSGGFLITPSGLDYRTMRSQDIVEMFPDGRVHGRHEPSTEWRMHAALYAHRSDVHAVVHTHSMFATTLACAAKEIPAYHYMVAVGGGDNIRCAAYETFGTQALADKALTALESRKACLLANHGLLALGRDLQDALNVAKQVEVLAEQYWRVLQIGEPVVLGGGAMEQVMERFSTYGSAGREQTKRTGRAR